jgi:hypothetical protein
MLDDIEAGEAKYLIVASLRDHSGQTYAQTSRTEDGSYIVEYRDGKPEQNYGTAVRDMRAAHSLLTGWAFDLPEWRDSAAREHLRVLIPSRRNGRQRTRGFAASGCSGRRLARDVRERTSERRKTLEWFAAQDAIGEREWKACNAVDQDGVRAWRVLMARPLTAVGGQNNFAGVRANELPPQIPSIRGERACTQKLCAHLVESLEALKPPV